MVIGKKCPNVLFSSHRATELYTCFYTLITNYYSYKITGHSPDKLSPMNKSDLIDLLSMKHTHLNLSDVDSSVKIILNQMAESLANNERIEIRGFGSFSLHYRAPRVGRNPMNGKAVRRVCQNR